MDNRVSCLNYKNNFKKITLFLVIGFLGFSIISFENIYSEENLSAPSWLKTTALWWSEDRISDLEFVNSLQYLIDKKLLLIPEFLSEDVLDCGPYLILNTTATTAFQENRDITSSPSRCTTIPGWGTGTVDDEFFDLNTTQSGIFYDDTGVNKKIVLTLIKDTASSWGQGKLNDQGFIESLQYLVENKILGIPELEPEIEPELIIELEIDPEPEPTYIAESWIRTTALWWGQGKISDDDYINALEYLIDNKIITITKPEPEQQLEPEIEQKMQEEPDLKSNLRIGLDETKNIVTSWSPISRIGDFFVQGHPEIIGSRINQNEYYFQFTLISGGAGERDCTRISNQTQRVLCQIEKSPNRAGKSVSADGTVSILILDNQKRTLYLGSFSVHDSQFFRSFDTATSEEFLAYGWDIPTSKVKRGFGNFGTVKLVFTDRGGNSFSSEFEGVAIPHFT